MELHKRAELALEKRDKLLMESYNRIENKMKLLGSTGTFCKNNLFSIAIDKDSR